MLVYLIQNQSNLKYYVGITRANTVDLRWRKHIRNAKEGRTGYLYSALRKHGEQRFAVSVLSSASTWDELCDLESKYIAYYKSDKREFGYNLTTGGEGSPANDEVRDKIRKKKLGGRLSVETKNRISGSLKGRKVGINAKPRPCVWKERRAKKRDEEKQERRRLREAGLVKWGGRKQKSL